MVDLDRVGDGAEKAADVLDGLEESGALKTGQTRIWTRLFSVVVRLLKRK